MAELIRLLEACERVIAKMPKKDASAQYCLQQIKKKIDEYHSQALK